MSVRALVIGGTGVAGGAAVKALRRHHGEHVDITVLWFGRTFIEKTVEGADRVLFGDITDEDTFDMIGDAAGDRFDWVFYATARGEVGFPVERASPEQVAEACRFSFDPLPVLEERFSIDTIVGYSTFYTLEHHSVNYGAMGYAKEKLEQWTVEQGRSRRACIRAGAFQSDSSRAIKLMLRKRVRRPDMLEQPLLEKYFRGRKPAEGIALYEAGIYREEKEAYGDSGTSPENLLEGHLTLLDSPEALFVNVCGSRIWLSEKPTRVKPD